MLSSDLIVGAKAAAEELGIAVRTVYGLVEAGNLPVIRKGRRLYFRRSELDAAFRSQSIHSQSID
jgi:excisionase family DNA binding protein